VTNNSIDPGVLTGDSCVICMQRFDGPNPTKLVRVGRSSVPLMVAHGDGQPRPCGYWLHEGCQGFHNKQCPCGAGPAFSGLLAEHFPPTSSGAGTQIVESSGEGEVRIEDEEEVDHWWEDSEPDESDEEEQDSESEDHGSRQVDVDVQEEKESD